MKRCSRCGVEKPSEEFPRDLTRRDELFAYCRDCRRAAYRAWYQRNPSVQKARVKARVAEL
jgi:hypothetical protein